VYYLLEDAPADKLWSTNGTVLGTEPVPGTASIVDTTGAYAELNGTFFFGAQEGGVYNVYAIDDPDASMRIVLANVHTISLRVLGDQLFIVGERQLWISDGTAEGTEIVPGVTPRSGLVPMDDALYFIAFDAEHGEELWRCRGTAASTQMVADIFPGPLSSNPNWIVASGDRLYFAANDGVHGNELWALARNVTGDIDGDGDNDLQDLSYLLANFGGTGPTGDLDHDGDVDLQDLATLLANFGDSVGP
jgi:ELWxxDGT repeat protein